MDGKIEYLGNEYQWWAGPADPDLGEKFGDKYCVHCCRGDYGVTRYLPDEPDRSEAEETAKILAPMVERLS